MRNLVKIKQAQFSAQAGSYPEKKKGNSLCQSQISVFMWWLPNLLGVKELEIKGRNLQHPETPHQEER